MRTPKREQPAQTSPSAPLVLPTVTFASEGCVMAYWHDMVLVAWGIPASLPVLKELRKLMNEVVERDGKLSMVNITLATTSLPPKDVRDEFVAMAEEMQQYLTHAALWIGETGFWASAVRSLITSVNRLGIRPYKVMLSGSLDEMAEWMSSRYDELGHPIAAAEVRAAMAWLLESPEVQSYQDKSR
jgi:hypothetical protein